MGTKSRNLLAVKTIAHTAVRGLESLFGAPGSEKEKEKFTELVLIQDMNYF